jgi:hypothetical protein
MAPYGGKGGILHLSYPRNEFGDPNFFFCFYSEHIINFTPGKFSFGPNVVHAFPHA